ncbi:MAG TPA: glycosyltransferase family 2 protein [Leptospiraceae bacterium]|jgi:dolichol-phosphate mannosyltransferase|nr:glycosyltransferase family 2 protein [Leptospirales bacterium]HMU83094.1 glycosyltransferase family 2 protein [Leptospiraceae bacterium]HMW59991.1 glycosyltransferase family 2 protein [Leptospiraceae bacterium]HMX56193.1 glycosyltransferase family 2 protein [Leptospiraceae bacterium]HMZ38089.1 glycosyltransferase family 2 protein [Leptospiraceae bacterium]
MKKKLISIVVPVYFEEELIAEFYSRMHPVMNQLKSRFDTELIFINDGSKDRSLEILLELTKKDSRVRILDFSRNFGHQRAITAGIDYADGDAVVIIDSDLQDPPEVIPEMIAKWEEGYDVVGGTRKARKGETAFKLFTARIFYRLLNSLSEIPLPLDTGDFRLMDRKVVKVIRTMKEEGRYVRGLIVWAGFRQSSVLYERDARFAGETKYSLKRMLGLALDAITSFSEKPLMLAVQLGLFITAGSFLAMLYLLISRILRPESVVAGWTSLFVAILFVGGVQILVVGILGVYIGRIYRESRDRPLYIVQETYGFKKRNSK